MFVIGNLLQAVATILDKVLWLYNIVVMVAVLVSWVSPDPFNPVMQFLTKVTDPVLTPLRRIIPPIGPLDISPVVAILLLFLAQVRWRYLVPLFGAAVPAVAVSLLQYPELSLFVIALYFAVQQIESHLIIPIVMQRAVGLSSLMVVLALLIGAKLGGILGILLSVPITTVLVEFINDIDKKKRNIIPE
jgi:YggT family protein